MIASTLLCDKEDIELLSVELAESKSRAIEPNVVLDLLLGVPVQNKEAK